MYLAVLIIGLVALILNVLRERRKLWECEESFQDLHKAWLKLKELEPNDPMPEPKRFPLPNMTPINILSGMFLMYLLLEEVFSLLPAE